MEREETLRRVVEPFTDVHSIAENVSPQHFGVSQFGFCIEVIFVMTQWRLPARSRSSQSLTHLQTLIKVVCIRQDSYEGRQEETYR